MRRRAIFSLIAVAIALPTMTSCSSGNASSAAAPSTDAAGGADALSADAVTPGTDAGSPGPDVGATASETGALSSDDASLGSDAEAGAPEAGAGDAAATTFVRVAHLSPDAPAIDFCLGPHGTSMFAGPVLKTASLTAGLRYLSVTKYLRVGAEQYDVRIVAPNAPDCSTSLAGLADVTSLAPFPAGGFVTLAAEGEVTPGGVAFGVTEYIDDATVDPVKALLRFVHASPGTPAVDFGAGAGATFSPIFTNVAFGAAAAAGGAVDANGYVATDPLTNVELSARASGGQADAVVIPGVTLPAGAIATAFAVGKIGDTRTPLEVLLCVDNAPSGGGLGACSLVGDSLAHVRVAHLSPDAPTVDVCVKSHAATLWPDYPLLKSLGATMGISYPQVTSYVDLAPGAYDVRVVAAAAADCATGAVPDTTGVAVTAGLYATIAAIGDLAVAGSDPGFALKVFPDEHTVDSAMAKLRFIQTSPSTPAVDVGVGTGASFMKIFANVGFGAVAVPVGTIDVHGFLLTAPLSNVNITVRIAGAATDSLTVPGISLSGGSVGTAFAIGAKTGQATNPLQVLICTDSAPAVGLLSACQPPKP